MKTSLIVTAFLLLSLRVVAAGRHVTDGSVSEAITYLTGCQSIEDLDESTMERLERLLEHPLKINSSTRSQLASSQLLSSFQTASLLDYLHSSGDILSIGELALVPGFGERTARMLEPFISLESGSIPGRYSRDGSVEGAATMRMSPDAHPLKSASCYALKAEAGWNDRAEAAVGWKDGEWTGAVRYRGPGGKMSATAGDFNVRFGQGLAMWSGFSMTTTGSVSSFCRRPSGITPTHSFSRSGRLRGVALEYGLGRCLELTAFASGSGCGGRITWYGRNADISLNSASNFSVDARVTAGAFDLFAEVCPHAAVAGVILNSSYDVKWAVRGNWARNGDSSLTIGSRLWKADITVDNVFKASGGGLQTKLYANVPLSLTPWWSLTARASSRYRSYEKNRWRTDLRLDSRWEEGVFSTSARAEWVKMKGTAVLLYAEQGVGLPEGLGAWVRGSVFRVDNWDDRIYVYQRDVPGSFNVPALYGRGWALSAYVRYDFRYGKSLRESASVALRSARTMYLSDKPSRNELHLQCCFKF